MRTITCAFLLAFILATPCLAQRDPGAERLVDGWIAAAGGPRVWDAARTLRYTITTVWYDTTGTELRRRPRHVRIDKAPGAYRVRVERREAVGDYVQVWDGARGWASLNGAPLADSARAVTEIQYVAGDLTYWVGLPWKLRDPGVNLTLTAHQEVAVTFGSGVGLHSGDRFWYYWSSASPLPTHVDYIEQGHDENDRHRVLFAEWQRFGPVVYASKRVLLDQRGRPLRAFLVSDVAINGKLAPGLFTCRSSCRPQVQR